MAKDSFIFYRSFYESTKGLKDKERLSLYEAICEKSLNDNDIKLTGIANNIFTLIKPQLEANNKKYENGKKGGRPKKETLGFEENEKNKNQKETKTKPNQNQNENKIKPNVNENAECRMLNVNENAECRMLNVNENAECKMIIECYEQNIGILAPASAELLLAYLDDLTAEMIVQAIKISTQRNKRSARYIQGILQDWLRKGYKTLADVQNEKQKKEINLDEVWSE